MILSETSPCRRCLWPAPVRIVGVGSPMGDDALAWEVIAHLEAELKQQAAVEFHRVAGGQRLLDLLDGQGSLLLVDALEPCRQPGSIHRFDWPDARLEALRPGSTHHLRPAEALELAAAIRTLPPKVVIYAVEAACLEPQHGLNDCVRAALPELTQRIVAEMM